MDPPGVRTHVPGPDLTHIQHFGPILLNKHGALNAQTAQQLCTHEQQWISRSNPPGIWVKSGPGTFVRTLGGFISAKSQHPAHTKVNWRSASFDSARLEAV